MTPEEFIRKFVDIKTASQAHFLDSDYVRMLFNKYADIRIREYAIAQQKKEAA